VSNRLQVLIPESEMEELQRLARREHLALGEWVRRVLREARLQRPGQDPQTKLKAVRKAVEHTFPTADVDQMLAEIERGYGG
jgi:hypothetical protein